MNTQQKLLSLIVLVSGCAPIPRNAHGSADASVPAPFTPLSGESYEVRSTFARAYAAQARNVVIRVDSVSALEGGYRAEANGHHTRLPGGVSMRATVLAPSTIFGQSGSITFQLPGTVTCAPDEIDSATTVCLEYNYMTPQMATGDHWLFAVRLQSGDYADSFTTMAGRRLDLGSDPNLVISDANAFESSVSR